MLFATVNSVVSTAATMSAVPQMDHEMVFGFMCTFFAIVFWIHQHESKEMRAFFAMTLLALSVYGFLQSAWPLGIIAGLWSIEVFRRRPITKRFRLNQPASRQFSRAPSSRWDSESRVARLFGSDVN